MDEENINDLNAESVIGEKSPIIGQELVFPKVEDGGTNKRSMESTDSEDEKNKFQEVIRKKVRAIKRMKGEEAYVLQVYVTCKDGLPKQFGLAWLFKECNIIKVKEIKYLNTYKIRVQFEDIEGVEKMLGCEKLIEKGWMMYKALQVAYCFGLIKNVDLDMDEETIRESISCDEPYELLSLKRLDRRDKDGGWCPSETVRLCFKGSALPQFVYVYDMKTRVETFTHRVTQCS
ncbi:hypothetical protein O0L34_g16581 [Tuta absoluta]|nr:hypothetical protein O0L34_g16581 [Tuta absoluta]